MKNEDIVITSAYRTAIGNFCGSLSTLTASQLGTEVIKKCIDDSKLSKKEIDTVLMGQVLQTGCGQNPARQSAIGAGIPKEKTASTINQVCGSGLFSVALGYSLLKCDDAKIVVAGGQESMSNAPHYIQFRDFVKMAFKEINIDIVFIQGESKNSYQPTLDKLEIIKNTIKGIVVASPANPTGSIIKKSELKKIAKWSKVNKITIISDEIYHGVEYGKPSDTILRYNKDAIVINSFSKYFNMTGWRLGWIIATRNIINTIERLSMSLFLCPPTFSQLIAIKAFDNYDVLNKNVLIYKKNRDLLINSFEDMGFSKYAPPDGAFYLYIDVSKVTDNSKEFAIRLLKEAGVSSTPGKDFDYNLGSRFIRFSYGGGHKEVVEGAKRIKNWIQTKN